jgi:hypothetical protein
MFTYTKCTEWVRDNALRLSARGYAVDLRDNAEHLPSINLKVSNDEIEAELVVWQNGRTSAMVYSLAKESYDLDQHDLVLSENFVEELKIFFGALPSVK